jgi:Tol biopolymer transport system component
MVEIISGALYLRQGPGINYPTAGAAKKGDKLNVLGTDSSHFWLQVITDDGPAWLSGKTVYSQLLNASIEELPVIQVATPNQGGKLNEASPVESTNPDASPELVKVSALSSTNSDNSSDKIIFMTGSGGELYSINVDGTEKKFLTGLEDSPTTFHGGVIDPVLSPDGRTVAFVRWDGAEFGALYTINVDGSNERTIVGDIRQPRSPAWSPDGTEIIVSFQHGGLRDPQEECLDLDLDDGIHLPEDVAEITKSKHGKNIEICFIRKENLQWALRRINVETGYFEDLLSEKYSITPAWNPRDKSQVIYKGNRNLVELDLNQNADRNLFNDPRDGGPIFSPDGTKIALTYKQHDHWEIHLLTLATGERKRLTKSSLLASPQHNSAAPTWSPDGQQIAFLTDRTGAWEIWVMNSDGSNQHSMFPADVQAQLNLRYDGMNERMLSWSP